VKHDAEINAEFNAAFNAKIIYVNLALGTVSCQLRLYARSTALCHLKTNYFRIAAVFVYIVSMVQCFAADCKHNNDSHKCRFYRLPPDPKEFKKWTDLSRYVYKVVSIRNTRNVDHNFVHMQLATPTFQYRQYC